MTEKNARVPADATPAADTKTDRRSSDRSGGPPPIDHQSIGGVSHDDLGNAVWEWRVEDVPRRRDEDPTVDLLECLDVDGLTIEGDEEEQSKPDSFNPYDKTS